MGVITESGALERELVVPAPAGTTDYDLDANVRGFQQVMFYILTAGQSVSVQVFQREYTAVAYQPVRGLTITFGPFVVGQWNTLAVQDVFTLVRLRATTLANPPTRLVLMIKASHL